jgi:hypothetical protein
MSSFPTCASGIPRSRREFRQIDSTHDREGESREGNISQFYDRDTAISPCRIEAIF